MSAWAEQADAWGAVRVGGIVEHFGDPLGERTAVTGGGIVADPGEHAVLRASGRDHRGFLHAQLASDVEALLPGEVQPSAWLNPKGQVICLLTLAAREDAIDLHLGRTRLEGVRERLRRFVLRAKVELAEAPPRRGLGLAGAGAEAAVARLLGAAAPARGRWAASPTGIEVIRLPGSLPRFMVRASEETLVELGQSLRGHLTLAGRQGWHLAALIAGVPTLVDATSERYIPQMLGLDELGAISFSKGCYPGQEVVARTRYLGRLKRRLYRLRFPDRAPEVLAALSRTDESGTKEGEVVDREHTDDGGLALAVVNVELPAPDLDLAVPGGHRRVTVERVTYADDADAA